MVEPASVRYDATPPVARITINRPEKRNALNVAVMAELRAAFGEAHADDAIRVVVLTGEGDKAFSAGGDLGGFTAEQSRVEQHRLRGTLVDLFEDMTRLGKPIVARVNGHALAGGFGLMCACDLIVAADTAEFGMPEINTGLWPFIITAVGSRRLSRSRFGMSTPSPAHHRRPASLAQDQTHGAAARRASCRGSCEWWG